jgi:hypothetical protein
LVALMVYRHCSKNGATGLFLWRLLFGTAQTSDGEGP